MARNWESRPDNRRKGGAGGVSDREGGVGEGGVEGEGTTDVIDRGKTTEEFS